MSRGVALICTVAVGLLVGMQPAANARLGQSVGNIGAAFLSIAISMVILTVALLVAGHPGRLSALSDFRPEWLIGGLGGAAVVTIGLIVGVLVDRFGWFGVHVVGLSAQRIAGLALVIGGTVLITRT